MKIPDITKYSKHISNAAILIIALVIAGNIYTHQVKKAESLKQEMDAEAKKNNILNDISRLEKAVNSYKGIFGKKDTSLIINAISNIANGLDVKIISISPQPERQSTFYIRYPFNLTVSANNYHTVGKFVSQLEKCEEVYVAVDNVSVKLENIGRSNAGHDSYAVMADLQVSSVALEN